MYSTKIKGIFIFLPIVLVIALLVSCSKKETFLQTDISTSKYIVSLSRIREKKAKLFFIDYDGKTYKTLDFKGASIYDMNYCEDKFFLYSSRINEHYTLDSLNGFKKFSLKSSKSNVKDIPVWFAVSNGDNIIEGINIGIKDTVDYLSSIKFEHAGNKKEVLLKWEYLGNAIEINEHIFVETYNEKMGRRGIIVVNKNNENVKNIYFENSFASSSRELIPFKEYVITYGDNKNLSDSLKELSAIGIINVNSLEKKELVLENETILMSFTYNDKIQFVTDSGYMYTLNENLEIISREKMDNLDFISNYNNGNLIFRKYIEQNDIISVLYTTKTNKENSAFIIEYDKRNLKIINKIEIYKEAKDDWIGEAADFILLN